MINNIILIVGFVVMVVLLLLFIFSDDLTAYFDVLVQTLTNIETAISQLAQGNNIVVLLSICALFFAKCYLPIPLPFICVITGMVYEVRIAFLVNVVCMIVQMTIKYFEGVAFGGGMAEKIINIGSSKFLRRMIEFNGTGNPYILFSCRIIPFVPPNLISRVYGGLRADFLYFICISTIGMMPRLFIYARIGHALFNPFSRDFIFWIMAVVMILIVSGIVSNIYYGAKVNQYEDMLLFTGDKPKYKIVMKGNVQ